MSPDQATALTTSPLLNFVKELSGRRIEQARKRHGITQIQFAREIGISRRWLQEIESGNPSSRLDHHVACAEYLELSTGHITLPLLFRGHQIEVLRELTYADFHELETECADLIISKSIARLQAKLTPRWWSKKRKKPA